MTPQETEDLMAAAHRLWPHQPMDNSADWRENLGEFRYSECLVAMSLLRQWQRGISPRQIRERVEITRKVAARPEYQPGGEAWSKAQAARGGRDYTGGPVEWDAS